MNPETIIDTTVFAELKAVAGDAFLSELVNTYCQETPQLIAALLVALARGMPMRSGARRTRSSRAAPPLAP